jgi:hypothetical protein
LSKAFSAFDPSRRNEDLKVRNPYPRSLEERMEKSSANHDRRRYPRSLMDLPLEYRVINAPYAHGGIVVNGSEEGFLIYSVKDMPIGTKLNLVVLFPKGFELTHFEVVAEIVRQDLHWEDEWEGFEYGLKFIQIFEEDRQKLKQLSAACFRQERQE